MKKLLGLALMSALVLGGPGVAFAENYGKQKVAYHINMDDEKTLKAAMGNIQNHITAAAKENSDLPVVMHGP